MIEKTQILRVIKQIRPDNLIDFDVQIKDNLSKSEMIMLVQVLAKTGQKFLDILNKSA